MNNLANNEPLSVAVAQILDNDKNYSNTLVHVGFIKVKVGLILEILHDKLPVDLSGLLTGSEDNVRAKFLELFYQNRELFLTNSKFKEVVKKHTSAYFHKKVDKLPFYNNCVISYYNGVGNTIGVGYGGERKHI